MDQPRIYITYSDFDRIASTYNEDTAREQILAAFRILAHMTPDKMWKGYEYTLARYGHTLCLASQNCLLDKFNTYLSELDPNKPPDWLRDKYMQMTHRSCLLRLDPDYYGDIWPRTPTDLYYWDPTVVRIVVKTGKI